MAGRPSSFNEKYCDQLIKHMSKGLSFSAFAGHVGVSRMTLYNWLENHPKFQEAKAIAHEKCRLFWENLGIKHILNESQQGVGSKSLNAAIWIFNMKNRFYDEWKDRSESKDQDEKGTIDPKDAKIIAEHADSLKKAERR